MRLVVQLFQEPSSPPVVAEACCTGYAVCCEVTVRLNCGMRHDTGVRHGDSRGWPRPAAGAGIYIYICYVLLERFEGDSPKAVF